MPGKQKVSKIHFGDKNSSSRTNTLLKGEEEKKDVLPQETKHLLLFPYDYVIKDAYTDNDRVAIHIWCLDKENTPHFVRIEDFPAMCYVELPTNIWVGSPEENVSKTKALMDWFKYKLEPANHEPVGHRLEMRKKVYYFRGEGKVPMLKLQFKNLDSVRHCKNLLKYPVKIKGLPVFKCALWEDDIDPVRKMLTHRNMSYSQWFEIDATLVEPEYKLTTMEHEYMGNWRTMYGVSSDIADKLQINPKIMAFDIECYSDDKRVFPDAWVPTHVAYMISLIVQRCSQPETRVRYAIILGPCADVPPHKLDKAIVYNVDTEEAIIEKMAEVIKLEDPELITGYNIFSFDYKYLHERLISKLGEWPIAMGKIVDEPTIMKSNTWSSGAYGDNTIFNLQMSGRINVDLLPVIKRDYKLLKYSLDFVSHHFLGSNKHNITAQDMFWIYEELREAEEELKSEPWCKENMEQLIPIFKKYEKLLTKYFDNNKTVIFDLYNNRTNIFNIDGSINEGFSGEIDHSEFIDFSSWQTINQEIISLIGDSKVNVFYLVFRYVISTVMMTFVLLYCFQDSDLVIDLFDRLNTFVGLMQMSQVTGVTIVDLFTRGQQVRCMSLLYDIAAHRGFVIDHNAKPGYTYCGGFVYTPKRGIHDNVICWDFASLYPTIIMAYNIDHTTLVHPDVEDQIPDELGNVIEFEQEEKEETVDEVTGAKTVVKTIKKYRFKYLNEQKTGYKGLIPELEQTMVSARRKVRSWLKTEKDPVMRTVYHNRQLALKVVCNSFYGFLGVKNGGKMPLIEAAMSITAKARESILKVSTYVEEKYNGNVVYGDTDSVMASLNIDDPLEVIKEGKRLEAELTALFPPPMEMELEKVMRILCLRKKRYVAVLMDLKTGELDIQLSKLLIKGIQLARRDFPSWITSLQGKVILMTFNYRPFREVLQSIYDEVDRLLSGNVDYTELITVCGLKATYKSKSAKMAKFAEELKKIGKPAQAGSRLEFLVVDTGDPNELQGKKMRLPETYLERLGTPEEEKLDYVFYIKKLQNSIGQILSVAYKTECEKLRCIKWRPTKRHGWSYFDDPMKVIYTMILHKQDHHSILKHVDIVLNRKTKTKPMLNIQQG
jgi:DNA polymerase elongation subunit (family B)